jgi:hypothetical protein
LERDLREGSQRLIGVVGAGSVAMRGYALVLGLALCGEALAADLVPQMGRYLPFYPGLYFDAAVQRDNRDSFFDASGERRDGVERRLGKPSSFPETRLDTDFRWYFPFFESYRVLGLSDTLYTARVNLGYARTRSDGGIADFERDTSDDALTDADDLRNNGSGIADLGFQFGAFLWGAQGWRENREHRGALLLLAGATLPTGHYDRDAPVSAGNNTFSVDARLALGLRAWPGGFIDAAYGIRDYFKNQDPAFGALAASDQGNDLFWDASIGQRVLGGLYLTAFASGRNGSANTYQNPRFVPNPPPPPTTLPASDNYPTPGRYHDDGTSLTTAGGSLSYFITQHWLVGLHYTHPLSGQSGEFDVPYTNRQPAHCVLGATGCTTSPGPTVRADGMGPARAYASNRVALSLTFNFGQGDAFTCAGCRY